MAKSEQYLFGAGMNCVIAFAAGTCFAASFSNTALAQTTTAAAASENSFPEVVVTARRKSENILRTPISIRAMTSQEIAAKGITTIQDIAQNTPGLNVQQSASVGGRADRSFTSIQLRGFVPSTSNAQTTSIFIDGAPVSAATAIQTLTNPERVEVIKGPQAALFGRQTFAGALNIVTRTPTDHLTGSLVLAVATHANYDVQGELSAPLIENLLSFRINGRAQGKHGSYSNTQVPGQTLGDQSTKTGSLAIQLTPTSHLTIRAFGLMTELKDGPAATGLIPALGTPDGVGTGAGVLVGQSNCRITNSAGVSNPFFCGIAPHLSPLAPSANSELTSVVKNFLARNTGRVLSSDQGVHGYGLVNHFRHYHLNADWVLGDSGVALHALTAWNTELKSELADLDNYYSNTVTVIKPGFSQYFPEGYYNFPFMIEGRSRDFSQELRATFENGGPLHASAGTSYFLQRYQQGSGSPYNGKGTAGVPTYGGGTPGVETVSGAVQARTYGVFAAAGYDFSDHLTINADARFQIDKLYAFVGQGGITNAAVQLKQDDLIDSKAFRNFMPRVIVQYNFNRLNMAYASYSTGVNPGNFNTAFITSPEPQVRAAAAQYGFPIEVRPEKIKNYEIGAKGRLSGRVRYEVAAYLALWTDQIQFESINIIADGTGVAGKGSALSVTANVNDGRVRLWGLEGNFGIDVTKGLSVELAGAYTDSYILSASNLPVASFYNIKDFRGKENPFISKWSGNASIAYTTPLNDQVDMFGRLDFTYKSAASSTLPMSSGRPT
jgi:iron complex outermembrane receptor protein